MSNTFGHNLRVTIFGQSHSEAIGAVIDGLPAGITLSMERIGAFMARRAPRRDALSTARSEADEPRVLSGLNERGQTCGAPLCAVIENHDARSRDYEQLRDLPRPGHSDFTAQLKYGGANDIRGGGQFSGRLTALLCFAGAVCMQLPQMADIRVGAKLLSVGRACDEPMDPMGMSAEAMEELWRAPVPEAMRAEIMSAKRDADSVGGVIEAMAMGVPAGLGEPMFDGLESKISQILFAIPGVRGVEFGLGFAAARMRGCEHNDAFAMAENGRVVTESNNHGGALGGISSGMPLLVRVAVKPTPSIGKKQRTISLKRRAQAELVIEGRHDPCIAPRALPCVEAALWIALADFILS